jgi:hypothetical protein
VTEIRQVIAGHLTQLEGRVAPVGQMSHAVELYRDVVGRAPEEQVDRRHRAGALRIASFPIREQCSSVSGPFVGVAPQGLWEPAARLFDGTNRRISLVP